MDQHKFIELVVAEDSVVAAAKAVAAEETKPDKLTLVVVAEMETEMVETVDLES